MTALPWHEECTLGKQKARTNLLFLLDVLLNCQTWWNRLRVDKLSKLLNDLIDLTLGTSDE
jgi:hypothetical protein